MSSSKPKRIAVVLAAGQGTRMKSARPKVLHEVAGRSMLEWVVDAARRAGCEEIFVVVGHGGDQIRQSIETNGISFVTQRRQLGTGHALAQVEDHLTDETTLLVLSGDVPLVSAQTLDALMDAAVESWGAMAVAHIDEPGSLGRVLPDSLGRLERIVEAADADEATLDVQLVNAGVYAFPAPDICESAPRAADANGASIDARRRDDSRSQLDLYRCRRRCRCRLRAPPRDIPAWSDAHRIQVHPRTGLLDQGFDDIREFCD
ncbi:MAG: NTP transferase domain-containing protein [Acidobacteriota bacterium]